MSSNDTVLVFEEVLVNLIKKVADEGDVHAQLAFGLCCEEGKGVEENFGKALRYLLKAAEQGNKDAQFEVGSLFMDKSEKKAFEWFLKAATQEHLLAQFEIAVSYKRGKGVRKDIRKATRWWNRAIKRANSKLPMRYFKQFGVLDQYRNVLAVMGWLDESHAKQGAAEECNDGCVYWRQKYHHQRGKRILYILIVLTRWMTPLSVGIVPLFSSIEKQNSISLVPKVLTKP